MNKGREEGRKEGWEDETAFTRGTCSKTRINKRKQKPKEREGTRKRESVCVMKGNHAVVQGRNRVIGHTHTCIHVHTDTHNHTDTHILTHT